MIGSINGKISHKSSNYIILEANNIGYKVFAPQVLLLTWKPGQELNLVIHTYVREDQITLYGFQTLPELEFFELLLTVSGVGPKSALGIMSLASLEMIKSAIVSEDPTVFTKVAGIGRKTAERVIVELKGKLKDEASSAPVAREHSDVLDALVALGYKEQEARQALKSVPQKIESIQEKIKLALKALQNKI
jgi:Holliday junction DNA helicase RuvA